jgi:tetratricopeptide (TPR) repeat protein
VNLNADNKEAQYTLATALVRLGRTEEVPRRCGRFRVCRKRMARPACLCAERAPARRLAGLQRGDAAEAVTRLQDAVELNPNDASLHADIGAALLKTGRAEDAVPTFSVRSSWTEPRT